MNKLPKKMVPFGCPVCEGFLPSLRACVDGIVTWWKVFWDRGGSTK